MNITKRQGEILNRIVQEYIESAQPVSSQLLEKKYDFDICPATIRIEMQKLTDEDFLYQPHTSAGRIPTDKGYRFFVNSFLEKEILEFEDISEIEKILREKKEDILKWASELTKFLAKESSSFTILHLSERDFLLKEGWEEILKEPEFEEKDFVSDFVKFLEIFEVGIKNFKINSRIQIYIGRENPLPKAKNFSIISSKCYLPDKEEGIISFLGPKRMAYDRNIGLLNSLTKLLEKLSM